MFFQQFTKSWLIEGGNATADLLHFGFVAIRPDYGPSDFGQPEGGRQAYVPQSQHAYASLRV